MLPKFKSGIIHLGIMAIIFLSFFAIASIAIFAGNKTSSERYLSRANIYQSICNRDPVRYKRYCDKAEEYRQKASSSVSISPNGPCPPIGDVDDSGKVNDEDAKIILNYAANIKPSKFFPDRADVNKDGKITSTDATLIRQYLAGQITTFDACTQPGGNKISWKTPYASLEADDFYIELNGKRFVGNGKVTQLSSTRSIPQINNWIELERRWTENGVEMDILFNLRSDGTIWMVDKVWTFNGKSPGGFIQWGGGAGPVGDFLKSTIGSPFTSNLIVLNFPPPGPPQSSTPSAEVGIQGTIYFKNLKLSAFSDPAGWCYKPMAMSLSSTSSRIGDINVATVKSTQPECVGTKAVFHQAIALTDSPLGTCTLVASSTGSECKIQFRVLRAGNVFALIDIDGNGTWELSSYSATLNIIPGPAPSVAPSPIPDPNADSDGDGFKDSLEVYMGTNPNLACGTNAWPPDINNDRKVDLFNDIAAIINKNGTNERRYDLNADGNIDVNDTEIVKSYYDKSC